MKIQFYIRFSTQPGESLAVTGNIDQLGKKDIKSALELDYLDKEFWHGSIEVDPNEVAKIQYSYIFHNATGDIVQEGGSDRIADVTKMGLEQLCLIDTWNYSGDYGNVFYTDPFKKVLLKDNDVRVKSKSPKTFTHIFKVQAPLLSKHEVICMLGNSPATGQWDIGSPLLCSLENGWWSIKLNIPSGEFPILYKYGVYNASDKTFSVYESGNNRSVNEDSDDKKITIVHDSFARLRNDGWKGAGVSIPVFSLKSKESFGVGEFRDIRLLADWAKKTGLKLIQLLPVNDTTATHTWKDSYPYASISAFALHPIYINLAEIAGKHQGDIIKSLRKKHKQLNDLPGIDYEQVSRFKLSAARELFMAQKEKFLQDAGFLEFFEENKHWLIPYSAFCYLRDRNGTADFANWKLYSEFNRTAIEKYVSPKAKHYDSIAFHYFLQYHLHIQ